MEPATGANENSFNTIIVTNTGKQIDCESRSFVEIACCVAREEKLSYDNTHPRTVALNLHPYRSDVKIGKFFLSITIDTFWFLLIIIDSYRYRTW